MSKDHEVVPLPDGIPTTTMLEMINQHQGQTEEADLDKIFRQVHDPANLDLYTDLSNNEITAFSVLGTIAEEHGLDILESFLKKNLRLRVSKKRGGRKDLVRILAKFRQGDNTPEHSSRSFFFGGRRG